MLCTAWRTDGRERRVRVAWAWQLNPESQRAACCCLLAHCCAARRLSPEGGLILEEVAPGIDLESQVGWLACFLVSSG